MEKPAEFSGELTSVLNEDPTGKVVEKQWTSAGKIPQFIIIQRLLCIGFLLRQREEMVEKLFSYSVHFWYVRKIRREKDDVRKRKKIKENLVIYCDYYACVGSGIRQDTARTDKTNKIKWKENERGKLFVKSFSRFPPKYFPACCFLELKRKIRKIDTTEWKEEKRIYSFSCIFPTIVFCCYGVCPIVTMGRHPWRHICVLNPIVTIKFMNGGDTVLLHQTNIV